jgi:hypothetical protein
MTRKREEYAEKLRDFSTMNFSWIRWFEFDVSVRY